MFYSFQLHPDSYAEWEQMWLIPEIGHLVLAQFHLQACMVKIQCWNKGRVPLAPKYRWKIFLICQEYVLCNQTHLKSWSIRREFKLVEKRTERCFFGFFFCHYYMCHIICTHYIAASRKQTTWSEPLLGISLIGPARKKWSVGHVINPLLT